MRALALKSVTDGDPARKSQKAPIQPVPISPWFTPASVSNGPLLQRKPSCACGGGCPQCQQQSGHADLQTKLAVSEPGDQYETEAERVSERILRMQIRPGTRNLDQQAWRALSGASQCLRLVPRATLPAFNSIAAAA